MRVYIDNSGSITYAPCCQWQGGNPVFVPTQLNSQRAAWNVQTPWALSNCNRCKKEGQSNRYREFGNTVIPAGIPEGKIGWLDFQVDTTCNGGCLQCSSDFSSYWQNAVAKISNYPVPKKISLVPQVLEVLSNIDTSELRLLQFLGGEPFLSDIDSVVLTKIANPEQCILKYTTNGSVFPGKERMAQWSKFKKIILTISVDGIGPRFDYLRYPLTWTQASKNIARLVKELPNVEFTINHSVNLFNVLYYDEFIEWTKMQFPKGIKIHTHPTYGILGLHNMNDLVSDLVKSMYGSDSSLAHLCTSNGISKEFIDYVKRWETIRGNSWKAASPKLIGLLPELTE